MQRGFAVRAHCGRSPPGDGLCLRTGDFLKSQGWAIDEELWAIDGADCSPCDDKVPDSH
ncbi:hypothetical protein [Streptomyces sp. 3214.6]|uniref:hypothetical protein n=1 Tax=Streptomyces sp. 3214.6 TaxID=1882757 RepID=UPI00135209D0|nr:hypothetical protein [Streptomyces sp. 3214.6]